jgi:hypothetical protein
VTKAAWPESCEILITHLVSLTPEFLRDLGDMHRVEHHHGVGDEVQAGELLIQSLIYFASVL